MSLFAQIFDKNMLNVNNLNYSSFNTILFQRGTVMVTEWVLFAALMR
jgi:alpha-1,3-glucosyltransferase